MQTSSRTSSRRLADLRERALQLLERALLVACPCRRARCRRRRSAPRRSRVAPPDHGQRQPQPPDARQDPVRSPQLGPALPVAHGIEPNVSLILRPWRRSQKGSRTASRSCAHRTPDRSRCAARIPGWWAAPAWVIDPGPAEPAHVERVVRGGRAPRRRGRASRSPTGTSITPRLCQSCGERFSVPVAAGRPRTRRRARVRGAVAAGADPGRPARRRRHLRPVRGDRHAWPLARPRRLRHRARALLRRHGAGRGQRVHRAGRRRPRALHGVAAPAPCARRRCAVPGTRPGRVGSRRQAR